MNLATAAVALVILVDLATGEGPPILNSYMAAPPQQGYGPPPVPMYPVGYMPRGEYDDIREERKDDKLESLIQKEESRGPYQQNYEDEYKSSTAKPGMLSSLTSSMSDAWKSFTKLGRSTRSIVGADNDSPGKLKSSSRSYDPYESLHHQGQSYVYFKVPRDLICGQGVRY